MTAATGSAQEIARAYTEAWMKGDVDKALSYVAADAVCKAPNGMFEGKDGFRTFIGPFAGSLNGATLIDVLGDDTHAAVVYTLDAPFKSDFPGMDYVTVTDGQITEVLSHFDLSPLIQAGGNPQH
ncbi:MULTISPECIES: nuclear transport factor 2 family protein [unclassified Streptomyces]|uniref:nuclear transport factor 2 family protein n=1 Tax=unclassified Streptomyces TaxID=2593676 RepID=UPI0033301001